MRNVIGLMSGTSMDGIDVALLGTEGERVAYFGPSRTYPLDETDRDVLRDAVRDARHLATREARPGALARAEEVVTARHAEAVRRFMTEMAIAPDSVHLVGFHGQTLRHDPARHLTVQVGDGQALADRLALPIVWDFRADDVSAGGQGAPLVPVFHRALMERAGLAPPVVFLNIGGVANVTYIAEDGDLLAFDTGPGNALVDDWVRARTGEKLDRDGALAASGRVSEAHLAALMSHSYFAAKPPKSLDRNAFPIERLADLSDADGAATLLRFTVDTITLAAEHLPASPRAWVVCGGGRHNAQLMRLLRERLGDALRPAEAYGLDGDATEAQAFAFLAALTADGKPISFPGTTGVAAPMRGGRISYPTR